jgi:anti-sigma factor RsiW
VSAYPSGLFEPVSLTGSISCEEAEVLIARRVDGELDAADAPLLDEHLKTCGVCRDRAEEWRAQSEQITGGFATLWPAQSGTGTNTAKPNTHRFEIIQEARAARPAPPPAVRRSRWHWLSPGRVASQVAALLGLCAGMLFLAQRAEAPHRPVVIELEPSRTPTAEKSAPPTPPSLTGKDKAPLAARLSAPSGNVEPVVQPPRWWHRTGHLPIASGARPEAESFQQETVLAALGVTTAVPVATDAGIEPPQVLENISLEYMLPETGEAGRVTLLGDVLAGRGWVKIVAHTGQTRFVAQADIQRALPPPLQTLVTRLIEDCRRPGLRSRVQSAIRKARENPPPRE